jgi:GT2 family glycosyltransferase
MNGMGVNNFVMIIRPKVTDHIISTDMVDDTTHNEKTKYNKQVSVIITAYDQDRYSDINDAVNSVLDGTYPHRDIIIVVDGNKSLASLLENEWKRDEVSILLNTENLGAAESRNRAVEQATGEIVAFMDDDAVADNQWLAEIVRCYEEYPVVSVGGKMTPIWIEDEPTFLPEEFYWLIGVTYRGFPDEVTEVRNTFASNITFDREVFDRLGGFNPNVGPKGDSLLQSAETEFCVQLRDKTGKGVLYNPDAQVGHKIFQFRTNPIFLLRRAFWQGVSKYGIRKYVEASLDTESEFITTLLFCSIPERINMLIQEDRWRGFSQLSFLILATIAVAGGYLYGLLRFTLQLKGE